MKQERKVPMKGFATVAVISILVVSLIAGCGGVCGGVEVYTDSEQVINTTVNQEFIIALDSNPTTGYGWEASYDENMLSLEKEEYNPDEKEAGLVGAGGTQYYQFKALKVGETEITVTYKRSWETEYAEQKVFTVDIK